MTSFVFLFPAVVREYQSGLDFRPLKDGDAYDEHQITVCVRKRPLSRKGESEYCGSTRDTLLARS